MNRVRVTKPRHAHTRIIFTSDSFFVSHAHDFNFFFRVRRFFFFAFLGVTYLTHFSRSRSLGGGLLRVVRKYTDVVRAEFKTVHPSKGEDTGLGCSEMDNRNIIYRSRWCEGALSIGVDIVAVSEAVTAVETPSPPLRSSPPSPQLPPPH